MKTCHFNKVIMLDFDGVLNSASTTVLHPGSKFVGLDPVNIAAFNKIVQLADPKIVITSTWRLGRSLANLKDLFRYYGVEGAGNIVDKTPTKMGYVTRGYEIEMWIETYGEPENWCIIDDSMKMDPYFHKLVLTSWSTGLTEKHIPLVLNHLGVK